MTLGILDNLSNTNTNSAGWWGCRQEEMEQRLHLCCFHVCGLTGETCCYGCLAREPQPYLSWLELKAVTECEGHLLLGPVWASPTHGSQHPCQDALFDPSWGHCWTHNLSGRISKKGLDLESPSAICIPQLQPSTPRLMVLGIFLCRADCVISE